MLFTGKRSQDRPRSRWKYYSFVVEWATCFNPGIMMKYAPAQNMLCKSFILGTRFKHRTIFIGSPIQREPYCILSMY